MSTAIKLSTQQQLALDMAVKAGGLSKSQGAWQAEGYGAKVVTKTVQSLATMSLLTVDKAAGRAVPTDKGRSMAAKWAREGAPEAPALPLAPEPVMPLSPVVPASPAPPIAPPMAQDVPAVCNCWDCGIELNPADVRRLTLQQELCDWCQEADCNRKGEDCNLPMPLVLCASCLDGKSQELGEVPAFQQPVRGGESGAVVTPTSDVLRVLAPVEMICDCGAGDVAVLGGFCADCLDMLWSCNNQVVNPGLKGFAALHRQQAQPKRLPWQPDHGALLMLARRRDRRRVDNGHREALVAKDRRIKMLADELASLKAPADLQRLFLKSGFKASMKELLIVCSLSNGEIIAQAADILEAGARLSRRENADGFEGTITFKGNYVETQGDDGKVIRRVECKCDSKGKVSLVFGKASGKGEVFVDEKGQLVPPEEYVKLLPLFSAGGTGEVQ